MKDCKKQFYKAEYMGFRIVSEEKLEKKSGSYLMEAHF